VSIVCIRSFLPVWISLAITCGLPSRMNFRMSGVATPIFRRRDHPRPSARGGRFRATIA
jgi:hypothetical protein